MAKRVVSVLASSWKRRCVPGQRACATDAPSEGVVSISILKDQADPPLKPREEYPAFLWKLLDRQPTLKELTQKYLAQGEVALTPEEAVRLSRMGRKKAIRDRKQMKPKL